MKDRSLSTEEIVNVCKLDLTNKADTLERIFCLSLIIGENPITINRVITRYNNFVGKIYPNRNKIGG